MASFHCWGSGFAACQCWSLDYHVPSAEIWSCSFPIAKVHMRYLRFVCRESGFAGCQRWNLDVQVPSTEVGISRLSALKSDLQIESPAVGMWYAQFACGGGGICSLPVRVSGFSVWLYWRKTARLLVSRPDLAGFFSVGVGIEVGTIRHAGGQSRCQK